MRCICYQLWISRIFKEFFSCPLCCFVLFRFVSAVLFFSLLEAISSSRRDAIKQLHTSFFGRSYKSNLNDARRLFYGNSEPNDINFFVITSERGFNMVHKKGETQERDHQFKLTMIIGSRKFSSTVCGSKALFLSVHITSWPFRVLHDFRLSFRNDSGIWQHPRYMIRFGMKNYAQYTVSHISAQLHRRFFYRGLEQTTDFCGDGIRLKVTSLKFEKLNKLERLDENFILNDFS